MTGSCIRLLMITTIPAFAACHLNPRGEDSKSSRTSVHGTHSDQRGSTDTGRISDPNRQEDAPAKTATSELETTNCLAEDTPEDRLITCDDGQKHLIAPDQQSDRKCKVEPHPEGALIDCEDGTQTLVSSNESDTTSTNCEIIELNSGVLVVCPEDEPILIHCCQPEAIHCANPAIPDEFGKSGGHAVTIFGVGRFLFDGTRRLVENSDRTAKLTGRIRLEGDPTKTFEVDLNLSGLSLAAPFGSPKKELNANAYLENGGPVDPSTWHYYTSFSGTFTGGEAYSGASITITRHGPAFQVGEGANGKNVKPGASGWFDFVTNNSPTLNSFPSAGRGDFNIDLVDCDTFCEASIVDKIEKGEMGQSSAEAAIAECKKAHDVAIKHPLSFDDAKHCLDHVNQQIVQGDIEKSAASTALNRCVQPKNAFCRFPTDKGFDEFEACTNEVELKIINGIIESSQATAALSDCLGAQSIGCKVYENRTCHSQDGANTLGTASNDPN